MEQIIQDLWNNIKLSDTCVIEEPEGEERESGAKEIFEKLCFENN